MGIIDSKSYSLHCPSCNTSEISKAHDKGSTWSGSSWQSRADFKHFETKWVGEEINPSKLIEAKCRSCGFALDVSGP